MTLSAPWRLVSQDATSVVLRVGDGADGARIQLARDERGRLPGVTPIAKGDALDVQDGSDRWPLIAVAFPDRPLTSVDITTEGADLLVHIAGPALTSVVDDPQAPDDPVLTWVRLRPRGDSWRVVVDGIATVSLPGGARGSASSTGTIGLVAGGRAIDFHTGAPSYASSDDRVRWQFADQASLAAKAPYPRTTLTLAN